MLRSHDRWEDYLAILLWLLMVAVIFGIPWSEWMPALGQMVDTWAAARR